jgi:hypothetical protein
MTDRAPEQPLRGDAAWRAIKNDIAKRNEAAQARSATRRAADAAKAAQQRRAAAKLEQANTPTQPHPS